MASSAYTLRYWSDTYDVQNLSYPYISIDNLDKNEIDKNESHIIRHEKCAINLIKSKNSNNTIIKIIENSTARAPNYLLAYFCNSYFGKKSSEIPEDLTSYESYTYIEFTTISKKLSQAMSMNNLYTRSIHLGKSINLIGLEASQKFESILTFISSFYNNYTNLLIDVNSSGEEIYKILVESEVESLFCSQNLIIKLIEYMNEKNKKFSNLEIRNLVIFEDSNKLDQKFEEYFENYNLNSEEKIEVHFIWDLIYYIESNSIKITLTNPACPNTPAVLIYKKENLIEEPKAVLISHHNLIGKVLGFYIYFQNIVSKDSSDIFAITKNISNLDCLCIFLMGLYLNCSTVFLIDESHLLFKEVKNNVCPQFVYIDHNTFLNFYNIIDKITEEKLKYHINEITERETIKNFEKICSFLFGDKLKIMMVYNQNKISHHQMVRLKLIFPIVISVCQGYREETIGSTVTSIINNLISGSFGLVFPCYEAKLLKHVMRIEKNDSNLPSRFSTIIVDNLDLNCNTFTGNLLLRGEGLFDGYFKQSKHIQYKDDLTFNKNWLCTNLKTVLTKTHSFKILDRLEDIKKTIKLNNINFDFIRSLLISKEMISIVDDVIIEKDEFNYELNIFFITDKEKWAEFLLVFYKINSEKDICQNKFDLDIFIKENTNKNNLLIFHKHENYYIDEYDKYSSNQNIIHLRDCIVSYIEKVLEKNYILGFENINKIYLTTI